MSSRLPLNLVCSQGELSTPESPASTSQTLELEASATTWSKDTPFCPGRWPGPLDFRTLPLSHSWELSQSKHMYVCRCLCVRESMCAFTCIYMNKTIWGNMPPSPGERMFLCVCYLLTKRCRKLSESLCAGAKEEGSLMASSWWSC